MIDTLVYYGYFTFGLYSLILILAGTPLNLLCFYIFKRHLPNRSNPTIIVFSYLALVELLIPFTWNLNYVIRELIWKRQKNVAIKNLEQHSMLICKLISYGAYFSLECGAWLKTLASFTRCVSLHHNWPIKKYISKPHIMHRICWITIFLMALINSPTWIVNGKYIASVDKFNQTKTQVACYRSTFFQFWEIAHLLLYNFIPFGLMILCNIYIIRHVDESRRRTRKSKMPKSSLAKQSSANYSNRNSITNDGSRLTKTLVLIAVFFIAFTSPSAIFYIFLGKRVKIHRNLITMGLSNLATTSHVSSFIIYWLTSTDFRDVAIGIICCRSSNLHGQTTADKHKERNVSIRPSLPLLRLPSSTNQETLTSVQAS
ncbi:unnamed protein product [Rotaria socialis]|uniref:G-protein coupled receptors family 1 profile domain-containing protein n=1 Tax=Rotaria socialis TaxID=392032 RepID=A0A818NMV4_9BILA|nr:unnamed protein product [Rotaria socialis]CAF3606327.1 unnamed protein product [Rotaria socialis]CAF3696497.1 unnamed protein product [Rotaria socialis]CAF3766277.1 unnamed protein product [Rotaria socialis]CAF4175384.1 unnamed protein product [Rotaria socialis]